jgi:hypothetical protein
MDERTGGHHLGVQADMGIEQTQEVAVVPIGPVHHGGDREGFGGGKLLGMVVMARIVAEGVGLGQWNWGMATHVVACLCLYQGVSRR